MQMNNLYSMLRNKAYRIESTGKPWRFEREVSD